MAEHIDVAEEEAPRITPRRGPAVVTVPPSGASIDLALLFGLIGAFALVLTALLNRRLDRRFLQCASPFLIVFLGTFRGHHHFVQSRRGHRCDRVDVQIDLPQEARSRPRV